MTTEEKSFNDVIRAYMAERSDQYCNLICDVLGDGMGRYIYHDGMFSAFEVIEPGRQDVNSRIYLQGAALPDTMLYRAVREGRATLYRYYRKEWRKGQAPERLYPAPGRTPWANTFEATVGGVMGLCPACFNDGTDVELRALTCPECGLSWDAKNDVSKVA